MKVCDECGILPANVHLTQINQNETQVFHLCEDCARQKGITISVNEEGETQAVVDEKAVSAPQLPDKSCSKCGLKLSEFRNKGWLGCAECYHSFDEEIEQLLIHVHGSSLHKGKKYAGAVHATRSDLRRLRSELTTAIKNEQFEQAVTLRDAIHSIKESGGE